MFAAGQFYQPASARRIMRIQHLCFILYSLCLFQFGWQYFCWYNILKNIVGLPRMPGIHSYIYIYIHISIRHILIYRDTFKQAYLGDIAGLLPDHCNEANVTIKQVTRIFWLPSLYNSYVYTTCKKFSIYREQLSEVQ